MLKDAYVLIENGLSPFAAKSNASKGRQYPMMTCDIRTEFQRDRDRIIHSKSFRRLIHKTQVFLSPEGDHYRTRLTHTLEVAQIARTITRALKLNEDLAEAIALGHDLGHTPFGHVGERVLNDLSGGFRHNEQSLRIVEVLENGGKGLNLTFEVRDGILNHRTSGNASTLEGKTVALADKIAYINHDIDDALRAGVICQEQLPAHCIDILGETHGQRIDTMIRDVIVSSMDKDSVSMSGEIGKTTAELRKFMFENVYGMDSPPKKEETKAMRLIESLYKYYKDNPADLGTEYIRIADVDGIDRAVCDYIAGMTDRFAVKMYQSLFIPRSWHLIN